MRKYKKKKNKYTHAGAFCGGGIQSRWSHFYRDRKKCLGNDIRVVVLSFVVVIDNCSCSLLLLLFLLLFCWYVQFCVCVKVQEVQSTRSPPPTSTTEQKTRPPPLHTRYPLVSTSIEDLFYRSLVQTRSRAYTFHAGAALFQTDLWVRPILWARAHCDQLADSNDSRP